MKTLMLWLLSVVTVTATPPVSTHPPKPPTGPLTARTDVGTATLTWDATGHFWAGTIHVGPNRLNLKVTQLPNGYSLRYGTTGNQCDSIPFSSSYTTNPLTINMKLQSTTANGFWGNGTVTQVTGTISR